ncbi:hypothetical protein OG21DRAFT_1510927 [Imleria badia]|nr:hypothetical protein OG21DRAFT_1510927 [Imleria badia]
MNASLLSGPHATRTHVPTICWPCRHTNTSPLIDDTGARMRPHRSLNSHVTTTPAPDDGDKHLRTSVFGITAL